jgi:hypothetical protein
MMLWMHAVAVWHWTGFWRRAAVAAAAAAAATAAAATA